MPPRQNTAILMISKDVQSCTRNTHTQSKEKYYIELTHMRTICSTEGDESPE